MKYTYLKTYLKQRNLARDIELRNCTVVIEGKSYFHNIYKKNGYDFLLGGEYDRFANHLRVKLNYFKESGVECYVVFDGGMNASIEERSRIHQNVIKRSDVHQPFDEKNEYSEPIFTKDVMKEVLEELDMKYIYCEYDSRDTIVALAKKFQCPVITNNLEFALYDVGFVILCKPIVYDADNKCIKCQHYDSQSCMTSLRLRRNLIPVLLTLVNEDDPYLDEVLQTIKYNKNNYFMPRLLYWLRNKNKTEVLERISKLLNVSQKDEFRKSCRANWRLCEEIFGWFVDFIESGEKFVYVKDQRFIVKSIMLGILAVPYINLINKGTFSGSWVIFDTEKEDAILPAFDIVKYVYYLLTTLKKIKNKDITFIGRNLTECRITKIEYDSKVAINENDLFTKFIRREINDVNEKFPKIFKNLLINAMPGFDFELLNTVPESCQILLISIMYYLKKNNDFIPEACSVLLSYVMLGPVTQKVGIIMRSNLIGLNSLNDDGEIVDNEHFLNTEDCVSAANTMIDLFYINKESIKVTYDRKILHKLAEFKHCLQHMNYFNRLCGERVMCTTYSKCYNGIFVYNMLIRIKDEKDPLSVIREYLEKSPSVLEHFTKIIDVFEKLRLLIM